MKYYIIRRVLLSIPLLLAISFIAAGLTTFIPSDPAMVALRANDMTAPTEEALEAMRQELGLDRPFLVRYVRWLADIVRLDFGVSYVNNHRTVLSEITRSIPATLRLAGLSFLIIIGVSIPVGVASAVFRNSLFDRMTRTVVFIGTAMPNYWLGLLLIWVFALRLRWFPTGGATSFRHYVLPAIALSFAFVSVYVRLIRNSMLANMKEEHVFYARVRGVPERSVILRHVLKNSLQTTINALGMSIVNLIAGTFVIETIFGIPGIGRLCVSAIFNRDYPILQAYILFMGVLFVFCNLAIDIVQACIDPRLARSMERS